MYGVYDGRNEGIGVESDRRKERNREDRVSFPALPCSCISNALTFASSKGPYPVRHKDDQGTSSGERHLDNSCGCTESRRQGKARQGKARQGKARQGKARQGKARQGKARQGKARQGRMRQDRTPHDRTGGDRTGYHTTGLDRTAIRPHA
jgi:hypothetical protein